MATITLKNIPDDLYELLKRNARTNHRSINSEIIACIERSVGSRALNVTAFLAEARRLREKTALHVLTDEELDAVKEEGRP
jgi:hypothetical protein